MKQSDTDTNNQIPYKYIDADNKVYKEPILKNDKGESSEDISNDISAISKKSKKKNINIEDMSDKEIKNLTNEKIESIRKLGKKTNNLQKKLKAALKHLNDKIQEGAEILYKKESNANELEWLKEKYDSKQNLLNTEKKINHSYKVQYKLLESKLNNRKKIKDSKRSLENDTHINVSQSINKTQSSKSLNVNKSFSVSNSLYMNIEDEIRIIKNKNKELISEINKIKKDKISQQKKVDDIIYGELDTQLKLKTEELQQFQVMKMECKDKYNNLDKLINMAKETMKHFEEKAKYLAKKDEFADKLEVYNYWLNLIKNEINDKTQEELIELIKNDKSEFLKELNKTRKIKKQKKLVRDASTDMIKENNNNNEDKKVNQNKSIYAIFSLLNNSLTNNNKNIENINNENMQIEQILQDENIYDLISLNEYRELIGKKQEYIETSMRLEKTIESFVKTENIKYSRITRAIKDKLVQLKLVKEKNKLVQEEVNNLENIYQLSLEKENIKKEINRKMNIKKNKNNIEKPNDDNNINDEKNNNNIYNETNLKENNSEEITNKEDDFPNTRDEQLKLIKQKYMEDENNSNLNNENKEIKNMENLDENLNGINNDDLNRENKEFDPNEFKSEQQAPFKV